MDTGTGIALGLLGAVVVGGGAYALTRGNDNSAALEAARQREWELQQRLYQQTYQQQTQQQQQQQSSGKNTLDNILGLAGGLLGLFG